MIMNKELKGKFTAFPTSLYNQRWVEKEADKTYKEFLEIFNNSIPDPSLRIKADNQRFAMIYYGAFEYAMNAFFRQVLEDCMTQMELDIRDLDNLKAIFYEKTK